MKYALSGSGMYLSVNNVTYGCNLLIAPMNLEADTNCFY